MTTPARWRGSLSRTSEVGKSKGAMIDASRPPSGTQIEIALGDQHAVVVEVGGGIRTYSAGGQELLDGYGLDEMSRSGRGQVLVPWPNRIQDGSYEFEGERHQLPINDPEERDAIHGLVRWAAWTVGEREPHRVVMRHLIHPQPGYPFSLALSIEYLLSDEGLRVRTTATNVGAKSCPYGYGAHPYVKVGRRSLDSVILRAPGRTVLWADERGIPIGSESVEGTEYDFRRPRPIATTRLDNAFTDLERDPDGLARVSLAGPEGESPVALWLDESLPYLMLFTGDPLPDVNGRSLAVEPMTCPPNAFRTGKALIRLEPGGSVTSSWGIRPS
jgi:aldose 1-epimerase